MQQRSSEDHGNRGLCAGDAGVAYRWWAIECEAFKEACGGYRVPEHTEQSLRNIFSQSAVKNYFYEMIPSLANPLGIGDRSMPIAAKVQNLLISDFLNYLALRHEIFLSTLSENDKKKRPTKP